MDKDQKLIEDVKALLTTAGFGNLTASANSQGTTLSGERGAAGAVFHLTPQMPSKAASSRQTEAGGPHDDGEATDAAVAPSIPGLQEQITKDPAGSAKLLRISPELAEQLISLQPKS